ncbi:amidohydrolase family protein [Alkalibaculum sp. M08DMB]|uniref:Amidohydrolase family protein n=1 Tax=Alkalibaculum sporogenes TaxID=2655001 RepID=A0A6A7KB33_9FIRM|nr:amidohydrolase family protein [Alkalibaculum sporogenes]MPW26606.1 amidohydrolase family protein [Alkalibaculum sporogenes]
MFIEAHMHISLNGENASNFRNKIVQDNTIAEQLIRQNIIAYKSRGILAIRDGGDPINLSHIARRVAQEEGIIYKTPIHAIYKKGQYGSFIGKGIHDTSDFKVVMGEIEKYKPDFIKIPVTGMMNFDQYGEVGEIAFSEDELNYMVKYAKDKNLPVMVHVNSRIGVQRAIQAGVDTIEHGYYMEEEELHAMKESNIIWVPTLAPLGNIIYSKDERYKSQIKIIRKIFEEQCNTVLKAYSIGVKLAVGSDAGAYKVCHGSGFFDELIYMNKAGIKKQPLMDLAYENGLRALNITSKEMEEAQNQIIMNE